uniref:Adhesion molecule with Ig like domain 2 n=1 Tax=Pundamilia nyererei TaxID=303518 RepID=A0A3B4G843_9CICH
MLGRWCTEGVLFLLCLGFPPSMAACPPSCLCASDIISCSGCNLSVVPFDLPGYATRLDLSHNRLTALHVGWISQPLQRLVTLILGKNFIRSIDVNTFNVTPHLLHLDLSSNQLTVLNSSIFSGLKELKELLLFDNQIIQIDPGAFKDLCNLQRLYLSTNRLSVFPLYPPLLDFRGDYPLEPGQWLRVPCPGLTLPAQEGLVVFWVTPTTVLNSSNSDLSARLTVLPNGTLEVREALTEDSGTYGCVIPRGHNYNPSHSLEVTVVVGNLSITSASGSAHRNSAENFNTAFTTLASCVVSIILVLLYLYLTPCRCRDGRGGDSRGCGGRAIILCSDPRDVETTQQRSNGKKVVFLEPQTEDSDTGCTKIAAVNLSHVTSEGILKNGSRTMGQPLTDPTHVA